VAVAGSSALYTGRRFGTTYLRALEGSRDEILLLDSFRYGHRPSSGASS
jgi:hypothetical protein